MCIVMSYFCLLAGCYCLLIDAEDGCIAIYFLLRRLFVNVNYQVLVFKRWLLCELPFDK